MHLMVSIFLVRVIGILVESYLTLRFVSPTLYFVGLVESYMVLCFVSPTLYFVGLVESYLVPYFGSLAGFYLMLCSVSPTLHFVGLVESRLLLYLVGQALHFVSLGTRRRQRPRAQSCLLLYFGSLGLYSMDPAEPCLYSGSLAPYTGRAWRWPARCRTWEAWRCIPRAWWRPACYCASWVWR
ncbi:unnamed protein product [Prorocentrum cordatum]|uniref:Very-long-chain (3R)-3-hydroxyacyl-CoA dehydratase n=1 Tax=Prorocentrum cordatum TaxID=2364126 RepID=A0ABN9V625_9DINO|nr:unnamed protein product [Polarella glacialis]